MKRIVCLGTLCIVLGPYTLDNVYETNRVSGYIMYCFRAHTSPPPQMGICFLSGNDHIQCSVD